MKRVKLKSFFAVMLALVIFMGTVTVPSYVQADSVKYLGYQKRGSEYSLCLYAVPQNLTYQDYGEVVYCFNYQRHFPPTRKYDDEKNIGAYYNKTVGTPDVFINVAENPRIRQADEFYKSVLRVLYNGYPRNNSGLQQKYGLSNDRFRQVTQYAVWYYTDSIEISNLIQMSSGAAALEEPLKELIGLKTELPQDFSLNIFQPDDNNFQNLLSSGIYYGDNPNTPITPPASEEDTIDVTVTKKWNDNNDQERIRPQSVSVTLYADNVETNKKLILSEENNWTAKFENLEKFENVENKKIGTEITYTVKETAVTGYVSNITGNVNDGFIIENTHTPEPVPEPEPITPPASEDDTIGIAVTKTWEDNNNFNGKRPTNITVRLYADDTEVSSVTFGAIELWKHYFNNLPKYKEGRLIKYSIKEDAVDNYKAEYNGFDIKNTYDPGKTTVAVTKKWNDDNNKNGIRPDKIDVILLSDGNDTGKVITLTEEGSWSGIFADLDIENEEGEKINYTVKEITVKEYSSEISGDANTGFVITNTYVINNNNNNNNNNNGNKNHNKGNSGSSNAPGKTYEPNETELEDEKVPFGDKKLPDEPEIVDKKVPFGNMQLPKTGGIGTLGFLGAGSAAVGIGTLLRRRKIEK